MRVELVHRPTGLPASDVLLAVGYAAGNSFMVILAEEFSGDGTAEIVLKRFNGAGGPRHATAVWVGYEE